MCVCMKVVVVAMVVVVVVVVIVMVVVVVVIVMDLRKAAKFHENAISSVSANDVPCFCTSHSVSPSTRERSGFSPHTHPSKRGSRR